MEFKIISILNKLLHFTTSRCLDRIVRNVCHSYFSCKKRRKKNVKNWIQYIIILHYTFDSVVIGRMSISPVNCVAQKTVTKDKLFNPFHLKIFSLISANYLHICHESDPNLKACMETSIEILRPYLGKILHILQKNYIKLDRNDIIRNQE